MEVALAPQADLAAAVAPAYTFSPEEATKLEVAVKAALEATMEAWRGQFTAQLSVLAQQIEILNVKSVNSRLRFCNESVNPADPFFRLGREKPQVPGSPVIGEVPPEDLYPKSRRDAGRLTTEQLEALESFYGEPFETPALFVLFVTGVAYQ